MSVYTVRMHIKHPGASNAVPVDIEVHPEWAPLGAKRFGDLIDVNYFNDCYMYRMIPEFIVQWGIPHDPNLYSQWGDNKIQDDPVKVSNTKGTLSFATSGPNARGSQVFVNFGNNKDLDEQGFSPFAKVKDEHLSVFAACGEAKSKVDQAEGKTKGNVYFERFNSEISKITKAERI